MTYRALTLNLIIMYLAREFYVISSALVLFLEIDSVILVNLTLEFKLALPVYTFALDLSILDRKLLEYYGLTSPVLINMTSPYLSFLRLRLA